MLGVFEKGTQLTLLWFFMTQTMMVMLPLPLPLLLPLLVPCLRVLLTEHEEHFTRETRETSSRRSLIKRQWQGKRQRKRNKRQQRHPAEDCRSSGKEREASGQPERKRKHQSLCRKEDCIEHFRTKKCGLRY